MLSTSKTLDALGALQREVLEAVLPKASLGTGYTELAGGIVEIAEARGFEVLGFGSSRVVVGLEGGELVAKIAHDLRGLVHNLQEATAWLGFPERIRIHLAPCRALSPELVLLQERAEPAGPNLIEGSESAPLVTPADRDRIHRLRAALGQGPPRGYRMDNFGWIKGDQLVALDYGEDFLPIEPVWSWVLRRLDDGPVTLDEDERFELYREIERTEGGIGLTEGLPDRPTVASLAARAGVIGDCPDPRGEASLDAVAAAAGMTTAVQAKDRPLPAVVTFAELTRPAPNSIDEMTGELIVRQAGIRGRVPGEGLPIRRGADGRRRAPNAA